MARSPLAFTCGDPSGIGPETVVSLLRRGSLQRVCAPLLVGEPLVWRRAGWKPGLAPLADTGLGLRPPRFGADSAGGGRASFAAVRLAVRLAAKGIVAGVVTAPVSKLAWKMAGVPFRDHTDYLAAETGFPSRMILAAPSRNLWTVTVTRHIPLSAVARSLGRREVASCALALDRALRSLGLRRPRLGLCSLNPHGGEKGLMGSEEEMVLVPARADAVKAGVRLEGPLPADAAWRMHAAGLLSGLVCLYHDQAMAPLKALAGLELVNWTVGIPFTRVSPGHGTAYDLAGTGRADPRPTLAAAELAGRILTACGGGTSSR
ncbi:MAG: 4-hydroxythreonine-4-phosphate dehydrogenase PdxA [Elusimicrobia bacterium]|nr:4-hydroxythreonine-4-phosphate dehydrogenase PdxA [Elusimicrobiota bacterium]